MARIRTGGPPQHKKKLDPQAVAKALAANPRGIDSGMLLNSLIECFGGSQRFSAAIFAEFSAAKEGSLTRTKIIEMISRLTVTVTQQEIAKPRRGEDMEDEELMASAARMLKRMSDGPARPASPAPEEEEG